MKIRTLANEKEHIFYQQCQSLIFRTPVRLYIEAVKRIVPEEKDAVNEIWENLQEHIPHITSNVLYSFDTETDADAENITVGELLLLSGSMIDRVTDTDPEFCFEDMADYLVEYGEFMFNCVFMLLGMVGDKLIREGGEAV